MMTSTRGIGTAVKANALSPQPAIMTSGPTSETANREDGLRTAGVSRTTARREIQLLLACARTRLDPQTASQVTNLVQEDLDWKYVFKKANENFVTPLLCFHVLNVCPQFVPPNILTQLKDFFRIHAQHNLFQTSELIRLVRLLNSHGIPALPFKGPTLAALVYGNLSLRQFSDLDILIRERDLRRAVDLLSASGYKSASSLNWSRNASTPTNRQKDLGLVRADGRVSVELHWRLLGSRFTSPHNMKRMWKRLETMSIAGSLVNCLPVNDLLLYLCMHGAKHRWERLEWIADVAEVIRNRQETEWKLLLQQSKALGCERALAVGLLLAKDLLSASIPVDVLQKIQSDAMARFLADHACACLLLDAQTLPQSFNYQLGVKERARDRAKLYFDNCRLCIRNAIRPNENDRAVLSLPIYLSFFYYLLRPIRLLAHSGRESLNK